MAAKGYSSEDMIGDGFVWELSDVDGDLLAEVVLDDRVGKWTWTVLFPDEWRTMGVLPQGTATSSEGAKAICETILRHTLG